MRANMFTSHHVTINLNYDQGEVSLEHTKGADQKTATCACQVFAHTTAGNIKSLASAPTDLSDWVHIQDYTSSDGYTYDIYIPLKEFTKLSSQDDFGAVLQELSKWENTSKEPDSIKQEVIKRVLDAFENNSNTLDLSHLGLKEAPNFLLLNPLFELMISSSLNLSHNNISSIGDKTTKSLNIQSLDLSHNKIATIGIFSLKDLKFLDISYNKELENITDSFELMPYQWEHFNAKGCPFFIKKLEDKILPNLKYLALENSPVSLNELINALPKLEYLEIGVCRHTEIVRGSSPTPHLNLKSLSLDFNESSLNSVEKNLDLFFEQVPKLQKLAITNARQLTLPASITTLPLKELNLSGSEIKNLKDFIGDMINLQTLRLSNCSIKECPPSLSQLLQLKELSIANNEIKKLPDSIESLTHLKILDISHNDINTLPPFFKTLTELQFLDLSGNPIALKTPLDFSTYLEERPFKHPEGNPKIEQSEGNPKEPPSEKLISYALPPDHLMLTLPPQLIPIFYKFGSGIFKASEESSQLNPAPQEDISLITRLGKDVYSKLEALCFKKKQKLPEDDQSLRKLLTEIDQNSASQIAKLEKQMPSAEDTIAYEKKIRAKIVAFFNMS